MSFANLIVKSAKAILNDMANSTAPLAEAFEAVASAPVHTSLTYQQSSVLSSGSLFEEIYAEDESWTVFKLETPLMESDRTTASYCAELENSGNIEYFIKCSYLAILLRNPDKAGLNIYASLLGEGKITRGRFLKILLTSDEAEQLNHRYALLSTVKIQTVPNYERDSIGNFQLTVI